MSSDMELRQAQRDALWSVLSSCPGYKRCLQLQAEWYAYLKATARDRKAAERRRSRALRPYLPAHVLLPVGAPAPETMRVRQGRPHADSHNPVAPRWEAYAPASGCREVRSAMGTRSTRSGGGTYGGAPATRPMSPEVAERMQEYRYLLRLARTPLPED